MILIINLKIKILLDVLLIIRHFLFINFVSYLEIAFFNDSINLER